MQRRKNTELLREINELRGKLYELYNKNGTLNNSQMVTISQLLDKKLNRLEDILSPEQTRDIFN